MTKKIKISVFLIALLGLINELKLLYFNNFNDFSNPVFIGLDFLRSIYLKFFTYDISIRNDNGFHFSIINITFYVLLLISVVLYHFSKNKETRLLRFLLSIIFFDNLITIIWIIIYNLFARDVNVESKQNAIYLTILFGLIKIVFAVISYYALKYFRDNSTLDYTVKTIGVENHNHVILTRKWQRFFHLIMDTFCTILLFSFLIESPILKYPIFRNEYMAIVLLFVVRMCYYITFESILGATPAKLLTESRVINEKGNSPYFINILTRSIFRFIPFEPFSFFGNKGWHDSLSNTYVAKEKRIGVKANIYLLIFPILIVGIFAIYYGKSAYDHYQLIEREKQKFEANKNEIENQIKNLSSNTIIHIQPVNYSKEYFDSQLFLKVENVTKNKVTASLLVLKNNYNVDILKAEEFYNSYNSVSGKITFDKSELNKSYLKNYEDSEYNNFKGANFLKNGSTYKLADIQSIGEPKLELGSTRDYEEEKIFISLDNNGWKADFIAFENNSGDIKWKIEEAFGSNTYSDMTVLSYNLIGSNYNWDDEIDLTIKMKDQNNEIHLYSIKGDYNNLELQKVN